MFDQLNKNHELLNNLVKEHFKDRTVTFMDYLGCVEAVYEDFITKIGLEKLKNDSEYVIGEIFDNSGLGDTLFDKFSIC